MLLRFLFLVLALIDLTGTIYQQTAPPAKLLEDRIHSSDYDTRFEAVMEISAQPNAVGMLTEVLNHDSAPAIRALAATRLGHSQSPEAVQPLLATLSNLNKIKKKDDDIFLQRTIVYALGNFHEPVVVVALITQLSDKEPMIRSAAVDSLGRIEDRSAITVLIQSLRDKDSFVRARAATALGSLKDSQAVAPLVSTLSKDESGEVRREAAKSLGIIGGAEATRALEAALSDKDMIVRRYSWEALHPGKPETARKSP